MMTFTYEAIRSNWRIIFCLERVTVKEKKERKESGNQGIEEDEGKKEIGQDLLNIP